MLADNGTEDGRNYTKVVEEYYTGRCMNQSSCTIGFKNISQFLTPSCQDEYKRKKENGESTSLVFYSKCLSDEIAIPYTSFTVDKGYFALYVVGLDIVIGFSFILFISVIRTRQEEYIVEFLMQTVQMSDFTVRVSNLPCDLEY